MSDTTVGNLVYELRALGNACYFQGDYHRAEQHYRLALNLYETSFPEAHEDAFLCLLGLAQALECQGKKGEARQVEKALPALNARRRNCQPLTSA